MLETSIQIGDRVAIEMPPYGFTHEGEVIDLLPSDMAKVRWATLMEASPVVTLEKLTDLMRLPKMCPNNCLEI